MASSASTRCSCTATICTICHKWMAKAFNVKSHAMDNWISSIMAYRTYFMKARKSKETIEYPLFNTWKFCLFLIFYLSKPRRIHSKTRQFVLVAGERRTHLLSQHWQQQSLHHVCGPLCRTWSASSFRSSVSFCAVSQHDQRQRRTWLVICPRWLERVSPGDQLSLPKSGRSKSDRQCVDCRSDHRHFTKSSTCHTAERTSSNVSGHKLINWIMWLTNWPKFNKTIHRKKLF